MVWGVGGVPVGVSFVRWTWGGLIRAYKGGDSNFPSL